MRILIVAGGTGGHIFPAVSTANKIKSTKPDADIIFCIDRRINTDILKKYGYEYFLLNVPRMPYKISFKWIPFLIGLIFSFFMSNRILNRVNPDTVVGFGAYISGPILMQAKKKNKKVIIHEQNVVMGRANRLLLKTADKVAISFDNPQYKKDKRYILTGNPIREELIRDLYHLDKQSAIRLLELDSSKMAILVMGGSLGSDLINTTFVSALRALPYDILSLLQIIHLTGKDKFDNVHSDYKNINVKVKLYPFFEKMGILYKASDFAISRAGASAITELCAFSLPAILIPYGGAGAHQVENARFLKDKGAALMIEERQLTADILRGEIISLATNRNIILNMAKQLNMISRTGAAEELANAVLK